jgi:hypothetical protein
LLSPPGHRIGEGYENSSSIVGLRQFFIGYAVDKFKGEVKFSGDFFYYVDSFFSDVSSDKDHVYFFLDV